MTEEDEEFERLKREAVMKKKPVEFGDTVAAYMVGVQDGIKAEREACAKVCDGTYYSVQAADAIRARSNT
jgi:hypothetical protein